MCGLAYLASQRGRIVQWSIDLREFKIQFKPKMTIKAHALSDFIVIPVGNNLANMMDTPIEATQKETN